MATEAEEGKLPEQPAATPATTAANPSAPPVDPAAAPAVEPASDDPDFLELKAAQEAAEAEAKPANGADGDAAGEGEAEADAGEEGTQGDEVRPAPVETITVPKARLDQALRRGRELELENARKDGELLALRGKPAGDGSKPATAEADKTPQQKLAEVRAKRIALASRYDAAEISTVQYEEERMTLEDEADGIRNAARATDAPQRQQPPAEDLRLDELTADLEDAHPYTVHLTDDDYSMLAVRAYKVLAQDGVLPKPDLKTGKVRALNSRETYALRERVAILSDSFGPALTSMSREQVIAAAQPKDGAKPNAGAKPPLSPQAQNLKDKLGIGQRMPPDVTGTGRTTESPVLDAKVIESMSDDEIADQIRAGRLKPMTNIQLT